MNKLAVFIVSAAMTFGFSQCRKPKLLVNNYNPEGITKSITFIPYSDNSKVEITDNSGTMKFSWNDGDKLQVYGSNDGMFGEEKSHYCGEMTYSENAFRGVLNNVPTSNEARLRFYFFGSGFNSATKECKVDLSSQDGKLNVAKDGIVGLASKIVAVSGDLPVKDNYSNEKLTPQVSIVKFSFKQFGSGKDLYFRGYTKRDIAVTPQGVLQYENATSSVLTQAGGNELFYLVVIPEEIRNYEFKQYDPENFFVLTQKFETGKFYYGSEGTALEIKRLIVPGEFSVSATEKVNFTSGNLQYLGKEIDEKKWCFATHQWNFMANGPEATENHGNVSVSGYTDYNYYSSGYKDRTQNSARDLFSWATSGIGGNHKPYEIDKFNAYGYEDKNLYDEDGTADWGKNTIYGRNDWRTLKAAEYVYMLDVKDDGRKVKDKDNKDVKPFGYGKINGVDGLIILPDNWNGKIDGNSINFTYGISLFVNVFNETTTPKWSDMENAGVVFLPNAGVLFYSDSYYKVINLNNGYYWSSTCGEDCYTGQQYEQKNGAGRLNFCWENDNTSSNLYCPHPYARMNGYSVRLVRDVVSEGTGSASPFGSDNW